MKILAPTYRHYFTLWVDGKPREVHTFDTTYGEKGWYHTMVSLGAFRTREGRRLMKVGGGLGMKTLKKRCHVQAENEVSWRWFPYTPPLPQFHHSSLWSLYLAIGYDYKHKRYILL